MNLIQGHAYLKDLSPTTQKQPPKEPLSPKTSPYLPNYYCSPSKWVRVEPDGTEQSPSNEKTKGVLYQTPPRNDRPTSERPIGPRKSDIVRPSSYRTSPYRPRFRSCNDKAKLNNNFRNFIQDRLEKLRERDLSGELKSAVDILTKRHEERWLNDVSRDEQPSLMSTLNMARNNGSLSASEPTLPTKFSPFVSPKRSAHPNLEVLDSPKSLSTLVETSSPPTQNVKTGLKDEEKEVSARLELCRQIGQRNVREMSVETTESGENVPVFSDATHTDPDTSLTDSKDDSFEISGDQLDNEPSNGPSDEAESGKMNQITVEDRLESLQNIKTDLRELNEKETDYSKNMSKSKLIVENVEFNEDDSKTSVVLSVAKPSIPRTMKIPLSSSRTWLDDKSSDASSDGSNEISGYPDADLKNWINKTGSEPRPDALKIEVETKNQSEITSNDDTDEFEPGNQIDDLIGPNLIIQEKRSSIELTRKFAQQNDLSNLDLAEIEADANSNSSSEIPLSETESEFTSISSQAINAGKIIENKGDDTPSSLSIDEDILNEMQPVPAFDECPEDESREDLNEWSQTEKQTIETIERISLNSPVYELSVTNQEDLADTKPIPGSYSPIPMLLNETELPKSPSISVDFKTSDENADTKNENFPITHDYSFQLTNKDKPTEHQLVQDYSYSTQVGSSSNELNSNAELNQSKQSNEKFQAQHPLVHDYSFTSIPSQSNSKAERIQADSKTKIESESNSESEEYSKSVGSVAETIVNNSIAGAIVSHCIDAAHEIVQTEHHINK